MKISQSQLLTPIGHPETVDAGVPGSAADAALVPPDGGGGARDDGAAGAVLLRDVEQHRVAAQTARRPTGLRVQARRWNRSDTIRYKR